MIPDDYENHIVLYIFTLFIYNIERSKKTNKGIIKWYSSNDISSYCF